MSSPAKAGDEVPRPPIGAARRLRDGPLRAWIRPVLFVAQQLPFATTAPSRRLPVRRPGACLCAVPALACAPFLHVLHHHEDRRHERHGEAGRSKHAGGHGDTDGLPATAAPARTTVAGAYQLAYGPASTRAAVPGRTPRMSDGRPASPDTTSRSMRPRRLPATCARRSLR
jgi:hypothetical protein